MHTLCLCSVCICVHAITLLYMHTCIHAHTHTRNMLGAPWSVWKVKLFFRYVIIACDCDLCHFESSKCTKADVRFLALVITHNQICDISLRVFAIG